MPTAVSDYGNSLWKRYALFASAVAPPIGRSRLLSDAPHLAIFRLKRAKRKRNQGGDAFCIGGSLHKSLGAKQNQGWHTSSYLADVVIIKG
jgi:hypothetical protein